MHLMDDEVKCADDVTYGETLLVLQDPEVGLRSHLKVRLEPLHLSCGTHKLKTKFDLIFLVAAKLIQCYQAVGLSQNGYESLYLSGHQFPDLIHGFSNHQQRLVDLCMCQQPFDHSTHAIL